MKEHLIYGKVERVKGSLLYHGYIKLHDQQDSFTFKFRPVGVGNRKARIKYVKEFKSKLTRLLKKEGFTLVKPKQRRKKKKSDR